jgi:hypothetical protein
MDPHVEQLPGLIVANAVFGRAGGEVQAGGTTLAFLTPSNAPFASSGLVLTRLSWKNADIAQAGAAAALDLVLCKIPARTLIRAAYMEVVTSASGLSTLSAQVGRTGPDYLDLLGVEDLNGATVFWGGATTWGRTSTCSTSRTASS